MELADLIARLSGPNANVIIEGLVERADPADARALAEILRISPDDFVQKVAASTLIRLAARSNDPSVDAQAEAALLGVVRDTVEREDTRGAKVAIRYAGARGGDKAVHALISALQSQQMFVRGWAASALAEIGDARAIPYLVDLLATTTDRSYELPEIAEALGRFGSPAVEAVVPALEHASGEHRDLLVTALRAAAPRASRRVAAVLESPHARVRSAAAAALAAAPPGEAVAPLVHALDDPEPMVVVAAAEALGMLRAEPAIAPLATLLEADNESIALAAAAERWGVSVPPL